MNQNQSSSAKCSSSASRLICWTALAVLLLAAILTNHTSQAGGNKGNKGGMEDIILYNGNIVMRGDKKGGSIVMANSHPTNEEVEFDQSYFMNGGFGGMGELGRRR